MITCNRCGNPAPASAVNCQMCGAPLSSKVENELSPRMGGQGQAELPAWLESLRAGERPPAPAKSPSSFSAADLVEEGTLPSWMRSEHVEGGDSTPSHSHPALHSSAFPGPNTDEGVLPARGLAANSLIDEQSLPSWMQEGKGNTGMPPAPGSVTGSSLVQPDVVPDWMKNIQQQSAPSSAQPAQPAWPTLPGSPAQPAQPMQPMSPSSSGFSARDLIDQQALPSWMAQQGGQGVQGGQGAQNAASPPSAGVTGGQPGFSASSLLDMNALPPWLREGSQGGNPGQNPAPPSSPLPQGFPAQTGSSWQTGQQPLQASPAQQGQQWPMAQQPDPMNQNQAGGGGLAASSFIDMNALPEWLRSAADPRQAGGAQQQGMMGNPRPGAYGVPPRVENVRVPSRPRGEMNPSEGSEVAANVFASMLGVASAAPNFPVPPAQSAPNFSVPPASPMPSPMMNPPTGGLMPPQQNMQPPMNNMLGVGPAMGGQQIPQGYGSGVYNSGYQGANPGNPNSYPMGNPPMGSLQIPPNAPGMPPMPGAVGMTSEENAGARPAARRGLFNAIREWLFR